MHRGCIISIGAIVDHEVVINGYVHVNAEAIVKAGEAALGYDVAWYKPMVLN